MFPPATAVNGHPPSPATEPSKEVTPTWSAVGGEIASDGLYTAVEAGDSTVIASVEGSLVQGKGMAVVHVPLPETTRVITYTYDPLDRLLVTADAITGTVVNTYDEVGNLVTVTDAEDRLTEFQYDDVNRLERVIDPLGGITEYVYDGVGNRTCEIDANGHFTFYEYYPLNRLIRQSRKMGTQECTAGDADDLVTQYSYDTGAAGCPSCAGPTPGSSHISKIVDPEGKVTYFKYDNVDRRRMTIRKVGDTDDSCDGMDDWCDIPITTAPTTSSSSARSRTSTPWESTPATRSPWRRPRR